MRRWVLLCCGCGTGTCLQWLKILATDEAKPQKAKETRTVTAIPPLERSSLNDKKLSSLFSSAISLKFKKPTLLAWELQLVDTPNHFINISRYRDTCNLSENHAVSSASKESPRKKMPANETYYSRILRSTERTLLGSNSHKTVNNGHN
jgi:hypothetical protein